MGKAIAWALAHKAEILAGLVIVDNALAQIPQVKANSTYQLLSGWLKAAAAKAGAMIQKQ